MIGWEPFVLVAGIWFFAWLGAKAQLYNKKVNDMKDELELCMACDFYFPASQTCLIIICDEVKICGNL